MHRECLAVVSAILLLNHTSKGQNSQSVQTTLRRNGSSIWYILQDDLPCGDYANLDMILKKYIDRESKIKL